MQEVGEGLGLPVPVAEQLADDSGGEAAEAAGDVDDDAVDGDEAAGRVSQERQRPEWVMI